MATQNISVAIGIDLGTTNTVAKVYLGSVSKELAICFDKSVQPTGAVISDGSWYLLNEFNKDGYVLAYAKRLLARGPEDPNLVGDANQIENAHVDERGAYFLVKGQRIRPEEVMAYVLARIRDRAEQSYGSAEIVVVATPIAYTRRQQQATLDISRIAGFSNAELIPEPVAALISYGSDLARQGGQFVDHVRGISLVLDIGGGTADMCAVYVDVTRGPPRYAVLATTGDLRLGGIDFDKVLSGLMERKLGPDAKASTWKPEDVKKILSNQTQHRWSKRQVITRKEFEKECCVLLERIRSLILHILDLNPAYKKADRFLLAGGQTSMPAIKEECQRICPGMKVEQLQGATAIANGAGYSAANFKRMTIVSKLPRSIRACSWRTFAADGRRLKTQKWECPVVIPQVSSLPAVKTLDFQTAEENQGELEFRLLEGESSNPDENIPIGEYTIQIPSCPAKTKVMLTLKAFDSGLIQASAQCATTNGEWQVEPPIRFSKEEIARYQQATKARLDGDEDGEAADDLPADNTPADDTPADAAQADDIQADDIPADDAPADDTLADDAQANDIQADDTLADDAQANDIQADDIQADAAPADAAQANDIQADDIKADAAPADDAPADDAPADDAPADDAPADDAPADDAPADDTEVDAALLALIDDALAEETPAKSGEHAPAVERLVGTLASSKRSTGYSTRSAKRQKVHK